MTFLETIFARLEKDAGAPVLQEVRDGQNRLQLPAPNCSRSLRKLALFSPRVICKKATAAPCSLPIAFAGSRWISR